MNLCLAITCELVAAMEESCWTFVNEGEQKMPDVQWKSVHSFNTPESSTIEEKIMQKTNQSFKTITEALLFMCKCSRRFSLISHKPLQLCYKLSAVSRFSAVLQIQKFNFVKSKQKFFWLDFEKYWCLLLFSAGSIQCIEVRFLTIANDFTAYSLGIC